jgi:hypothetical protein
MDEFAVFQRCVASFRQAVQKMEQSSDGLRAHERLMRS